MLIPASNAHKAVKSFMEEHSNDLLACEVVTICQKHLSGKFISQAERSLVGLRYSEYLTDETTDEAYIQAETLAEALRVKHGVDYDNLRDKCKRMGWH